MREVSDGDITGANNSFIGPNKFNINGSSSSFSAMQGFLDGSGNTHSTTIPTSNRIDVNVSKYDPDRAHIIIYNYEEATSESVDFSSFLTPGQSWSTYWPWNIQMGVNPNNSIVEPVPIQTGTYSGGSVTLDWSDAPDPIETIQNTGFWGPLNRHERIAAFIVIGE